MSSYTRRDVTLWRAENSTSFRRKNFSWLPNKGLCVDYEVTAWPARVHVIIITYLTNREHFPWSALSWTIDMTPWKKWCPKLKWNRQANYEPQASHSTVTLGTFYGAVSLGNIKNADREKRNAFFFFYNNAKKKKITSEIGFYSHWKIINWKQNA